MKQFIKLRLKSFGFAFKGLGLGFAQEVNFRIHVLGAVVTVVLGFIFQLSPLEWIGIVLCIGLVLAFELINTALEELTDLVSPTFNPLAGKVKDLAAAASLVVSITAFIIGLIIFIPHFFACL